MWRNISWRKKKTSSFKHAAWSKDSILCFWRDCILYVHSSDTYCLYEADILNCLYEADTPPYCLQPASDLPLPRQRDVTASHTLSMRNCADVLRDERADVTDFFLFSWPWWMGSVVKHNMLKEYSSYALTDGYGIQYFKYNVLLI